MANSLGAHRGSDCGIRGWFGDDGWMNFSSRIFSINIWEPPQPNMTNDLIRLPLDNPNVFTDGMLAGVALEAFREMQIICQALNLPQNNWPFVMTAIQLGGEIFLASSLKYRGDGFVNVFPNSPVAESLRRCANFPEELPVSQYSKRNGYVHRAAGNCGEPCAMQLLYNQYPTTNPKTTVLRWRCVTICGDRGGSILPACGRERPGSGTKMWGCSRFLTELNVREVDSHTVIVPFNAHWVVDVVDTCLTSCQD